MSLLKGIKITRIMAAVADGQATTSSDILDMSDYEGVMFIAKFSDVTSAAVLTMAAQQNIIDSGTGMATLSGTVTFTATSGTDADDDLLVLDIYRPQERYLRVQVTTATQNAVVAGVIAIQYGCKKVPITQPATVLDSDLLISPSEA